MNSFATEIFFGDFGDYKIKPNSYVGGYKNTVQNGCCWKQGEEHFQLSNDSIPVVLSSSSHILHPSMLCQSLAAIFYQYFVQHLVIKNIYYKGNY